MFGEGWLRDCEFESEIEFKIPRVCLLLCSFVFSVPAVRVSLLAGVPSVSRRCPVGALSVPPGVRYVMYWFGMPGPPFRCFCGLYDQCCVSFLFFF